MLLTFANNKSINTDYFSVTDGIMLIKTKWSTFEEMKSLCTDPFATSRITVENEDLESEIYENYVQFEEITEDKDGTITVILSQDGKGTVERITALENEMKTAKGDIEELKQTGGADIEAYSSVLTLAKIEAQKITDDKQAITVKELFDEWSGESVEYAEDTYLRYGILLYKVIKAHISQADRTPDTAYSLFTPVGEPDAGTEDNPIVWVSGMESEKDKYYTDEGVLYIGLEDSKIGLHGQPKDLARYFKTVEAAS